MNDHAYRAPLLENGEHLDQETFHQRYQASPPGFKAELVGGMVFVASPVRSPHAQYHGLVIEWLGRYRTATPGVTLHDNATILLGDYGEPQPDAALCVAPECGGRSHINDADYVVGPPELIVEVAHSSQSFDLHEKRRDYERAGVLEYIVVAIRNRAVHWFVLKDGALEERPLPEAASLQSAVFPGLWLDAPAMLRLDPRGVADVLEQGLASDEHAAFVQQLEQARRSGE